MVVLVLPGSVGQPTTRQLRDAESYALVKRQWSARDAGRQPCSCSLVRSEQAQGKKPPYWLNREENEGRSVADDSDARRLIRREERGDGGLVLRSMLSPRQLT